MSFKFEKNYKKRIAMRAIYPSFLQEVWDYFVYFMTVFIIVSLSYAFMRYAIFDSIKIVGFSMYPYHKTDDIIYIDLLSKHFSDYKRGDVVVIKAPETCSDGTELYIKRIIGLPGETISFENGHVYVYNSIISNDKVKLDESDYIANDVLTYKNITPPNPNDTNKEPETVEKTLGKDEYFFMGDNRTGSIDSRKCGPIKKQNVLGKEFYRFDTDNNPSFTKDPSYNIPSQY